MCELQQAANAGWCEGASGVNRYLWSSPAWLAYEAGRNIKRMGLSAPSRARIGRGYSVRIKPCGDPGRRVVFNRDSLALSHIEIDYAA